MFKIIGEPPFFRITIFPKRFQKMLLLSFHTAVVIFLALPVALILCNSKDELAFAESFATPPSSTTSRRRHGRKTRTTTTPTLLYYASSFNNGNFYDHHIDNDNNDSKNQQQLQQLNLYQILGIETTASWKEIRLAYHNQSAKYCQSEEEENNDTDVERSIQELNYAYSILRDPSLRKDYDNQMRFLLETPPPISGRGFNMDGPGFTDIVCSDSTPIISSPPTEISSSSSNGDCQDYHHRYDNARTSRNTGWDRAGIHPSNRIVGRDIQLDLEIDFHTSLFGGVQWIQIQKMETCPGCQGTGIEQGSRIFSCHSCGGTGIAPLQVVGDMFQQQQQQQQSYHPVHHHRQQQQQQQGCPTCRGRGHFIEKECRLCHGHGIKPTIKEIAVNIPSHGNQVRIHGEGDVGLYGGPPGDLYVHLRVKDNPTFSRKGSDIYSNETIGLVDAILGTTISTPTVEGKDVPMDIPPGTQPFHVVKFQGNGGPRHSYREFVVEDRDDDVFVANDDDGIRSSSSSASRGDHHVTVNVKIPTDLSPEEIEIVKQLKVLQETKRQAQSKEKEEEKNSVASVGLSYLDFLEHGSETYETPHDQEHQRDSWIFDDFQPPYWADLEDIGGDDNNDAKEISVIRKRNGVDHTVLKP